MNTLNIIFKLLILVFLVSCVDFIEIEPPRTDLIKSTVFSDDATASAAMTDVYYQIGCIGFGSGNTQSISMITALSSDELINGITYNNDFEQINLNSILPTNSITSFLWQDMYNCIYKCNAIIEGLSGPGNVSPAVKAQLLGEAKFFRAVCHFYLFNLFGEIPLITTTDYKLNQSIGRIDEITLHQQIITDLIEAKNNLIDDYSFSNGEKIRVNRQGATAFLARIYLYRGDWNNAEIESTNVIENETYLLENDLNHVFLKNSNEAILQFYPPSDGYTNDVITFLGYGSSLRPELTLSFETNDKRKTYWVGNGEFGPFDYPTKYLSYDGSFTEYSMVLRLAEQYLIRAEARAKQNKLDLAKADLNVIRNRAGLPETDANDITSVLNAITHERRVELFSEWGHRWFDLKRNGLTDEVLDPIKDNWESTDELYPIPKIQLDNSKSMQQNPGYPVE